MKLLLLKLFLKVSLFIHSRGISLLVKTQEERIAIKVGEIHGSLEHMKTCPKCNEALIRFARSGTENMAFFKELLSEAQDLVNTVERSQTER